MPLTGSRTESCLDSRVAVIQFHNVCARVLRGLHNSFGLGAAIWGLSAKQIHAKLSLVQW